MPTKENVTYSDVGFAAFGHIGRYVIDTSLLISQGAGMILSLEQSVPEHLRGSFKYYFVVTITAVTTLYIVFGGSGYLSFGPETMDIITLNLPHEGGIDFAVVVKLCLCIALFFTYPVMLFPVTSLIRQRTQHYLGCADDTSKFVGFFIRFSLVTLTGLIVIH